MAREFLIAGAAEKTFYRTITGMVFVYCHVCGSGETGTLPPWHPHLPSTWQCFECGAKWSIHKVSKPRDVY